MSTARTTRQWWWRRQVFHRTLVTKRRGPFAMFHGVVKVYRSLPAFNNSLLLLLPLVHNGTCCSLWKARFQLPNHMQCRSVILLKLWETYSLTARNKFGIHFTLINLRFTRFATPALSACIIYDRILWSRGRKFFCYYYSGRAPETTLLLTDNSSV